MERLRISIVIIGLVVLTSISSMAAGSAKNKIGLHSQSEGLPITNSLLRVDRVNVSHIDTVLCLSFDINLRKVHPGSDRQIVFTPVIRNLETSATDSIVLDPIIIAGRNRYFSHVRKGDISAGDSIFRAGEKKLIKYARYVPWQEWMNNGLILIREVTQDCCRPLKPLCDTPVAQINTLEDLTTNSIESIEYIPLTGDSTIELEAQGRAFVDFHVNKWDIDENYRNNSIELDKIIESVNVIKNDPDAIITRLSIKGYASPEGNYYNNVRLAMGRTEALKEYVRKKYQFDPEILMTSYEAEDWEGLKTWLDSCSLSNRDEIIAIVDSDLDPDAKDEAIKSRFPKEYNLLLDQVYPSLRHSDYSIRYKIRVYATDEELKAVYDKTPERLRPVDFFRVANLFPWGSDDFEEVLLKASEYYPNDPEASVNAANIFLSRGDIVQAENKLTNAGESGEAYYSRGMLAALNGDSRRAEFLFKKAKELGVDRAASQLNLLQQAADNEVVTYFIQADD